RNPQRTAVFSYAACVAPFRLQHTTLVRHSTGSLAAHHPSQEFYVPRSDFGTTARTACPPICADRLPSTLAVGRAGRVVVRTGHWLELRRAVVHLDVRVHSGEVSRFTAHRC